MHLDSLESGNNIVDYMFVSDGIQVKNFEVLQTGISDHLPLLLEFDLTKVV
jgi:endonuclease/exonuclease/phosphatase family metal-dependent hydrolase